MTYEYAIIGGGPTGLTLALYLSKLQKKCVLIDKNDSLGGCHRVSRVDNKYFTEHGPRVYSSAYVNFIDILYEIGTTWDQSFTPYNFNLTQIEGETSKNFTFFEKKILVYYFMLQIIGIKQTKLSVLDMCQKHNFSEKACDYLDRICRLTDGAGSDRYTVYQLLQLVNENVFYKLYQPKQPNDKHLFPLWEKKLIENGVHIKKNTNVTFIQNNLISTTNGNFQAEKIIFCIPPNAFTELSKNSFIGNTSLFDIYIKKKNVNLDYWSQTNSYIIDIPISFHWKKKTHLEKKWGFPRDDWGIAFIILSDYMSNPEDDTKLLISTCITKVNEKSSVTNKTPMESTEEELISETFRQLKLSFPNLPLYDKALIHKKTLSEEDSAFVFTKNALFLDMHITDHFYNVGTQNGKSFYSFTSMESAVTNALFALKKLEKKYKFLNIQKMWTLTGLIHFIVFIIFFVVFLKIFLSKF
jgi:protoporphyrinogen oxidase